MKETSGKIEEVSGKIRKNNVNNEITDKVWIKLLGILTELLRIKLL